MSEARQSHLPTPGVHSIPSEPFRFEVESRGRANVRHLVDLAAFDWNGHCSCEYFEFNCLPLLTRGAHAAMNLQCFHLLRARFYCFRELAKAVSDQYYKLREAREGKPGPTKTADGKTEYRIKR